MNKATETKIKDEKDNEKFELIMTKLNEISKGINEYDLGDRDAEIAELHNLIDILGDRVVELESLLDMADEKIQKLRKKNAKLKRKNKELRAW